MKKDKIGIALDILEKVLTVVGWALVILGLFFFTLPEKGLF
jgi:hypothetical protein